MQFQSFNVSNYPQPKPVEPPMAEVVGESADLLRQILEVQKQQLAILQAQQAAHDTTSRWRAFLARWREDFPDLAEFCKEVLPLLEKSYGTLIADLADHLRMNGSGALDNDFALQEFLDRYGMRLAQLGTILNLVAPLAEAGPQGQGESST